MDNKNHSFIVDMTTFYLIRHAHADFSSDEQRTLSMKGQRDSDNVAEVLGKYPITHIYSSPYQRALQTVEPLAEKLDLAVQVEPDLRERCLGHGPEGGDFLSMVKHTWQEPSFSFPGGESNESAQQRGMRVVRKLLEQHSGEHLVLSTHGNLMCLILQFFDNRIEFDFWKALSMPDIYTLYVMKDGMNIERIWQP